MVLPALHWRIHRAKNRTKHHRRRCQYETLENRRVLATFLVNTTTDVPEGDCSGSGNTCSIRTALQAAASTVESNRIQIPAGTYNLDADGGSLTYFAAHALTIIGTATTSADVIIDAASQSTVFNFGSGAANTITNISINALTIQRGAGNEAGGLSLLNVNATLNDVNVVDNFSFGGGGGLTALSTSSGPIPLLTINDSTFTNNRAVGSGGGIYAESVNMDVDNTSFVGNEAGAVADGVSSNGAQGGGLAMIGISSLSSATFDNVVMEQNEAPSAGGIGIVNADVTIIGGKVAGNLVAPNNRGAMAIAIASDSSLSPGDTAKLSLQTTSVSNNGFLSSTDEPLTSTPVAIHSVDADISVVDTDISGNGGGGIGFYSDLRSDSDLTMIRSSVTSNRRENLPVFAVQIDQGTFLIENTTIADNGNIDNSGGIELRGDPTGDIISSTVANNGNGVGIAGYGGSIRFESTIIDDQCQFFGSVTSGGYNLDTQSSCGLLEPTDIRGIESGRMSLANHGGNVLTYSLQPTSPAIDAGSPNSPATDARGVVRPLDGDGDAIATPDIGAFEADPIARPILTINDVTVSEGDGTATIVVSLNANTQEFSVDVSTVDGTAESPADFTSSATTLSFVGQEGETQAITIPITDDDIVEPLETFSLEMSNLVFDSDGLTPDISDTASVSIEDTDRAMLTIENIVVNEEDLEARLFISLDNPVAQSFTVDVATTDGTATNGEDYTSVAETLTITGNAGETTEIVVVLIDDSVVEFDEFFTVAMSNVSNLRIDLGSPATTTILNEDSAALTVEGTTVIESSGTATITVRLDHAVQGGFTVDVSTSDGSAVNPDDYTATNVTLEFAGNADEVQTFSIPIEKDSIVEFDETVLIQLSGDPDALIAIDGTATLTIIDDDIATLTIDDVVVNEGDETAIVVVSLDANVPGGFDVNVNIIGGSATNGTDYAASNAKLVFAGEAGETQSFNVAILEDDDVEIDETILIGLSGATSPLVNTDDDGTLTIIDNDVSTVTSIRGHVFCDANADGDEDPGEESASAIVFLDRNENRRLDTGELQTMTDSSGDYSFTDVAAGGVVVAVPVPSGCRGIPSNPGVTRTLIDAGNLARSITAADVDGDLDNDLLIAFDADQSLVVLNNQDGMFTVDRTIRLSNRPYAVSTWTPIGESSTPIIGVASIGDAGNDGILFTGPLSGLSAISAGDGPVEVAIDDFDHDNQADFLTASFRSSELRLRMSGADESAVIATGPLVRAVTSGDVNGDELADIVYVAAGYDPDTTSEIGILFGDGSGSFSEPITVTSVRDLVAVRIGDVDGNGTNEVLVLSQTGSLIALTAANNSIVEVNRTTVLSGASSFDVGDFNRDEQVDVAIGNEGRNLVQILTGDSTGQFDEIVNVTDIYAPSDLVVVDLNGDGFAEVAVTNLYDNVAAPGADPVYRLPSTLTLLHLDVAEIALTVDSQVIVQGDVVFVSAPPEIRFDTTGEGEITSLDALRVINAIDRFHGAGESSLSDSKIRSITDVNDDGRTTAIDALMIINHLSRVRISTSRPFALALNDGDDDEREFQQPFSAIDQFMSNEL